MSVVEDLPRAPPRGRYDRSATVSERVNQQRELVLMATRTALVHSMPSSITVAQLTSASGLGRNTLYGHFPSTNAACQAVFEQCWSQLQAELGRRPLQSATPMAQCQELAQRWLFAAAACSETFQILTRSQNDEIFGRIYGELSELWASGARAGAFSADADAARLRALAAALLRLISDVAQGQTSAAHAAALATDVLTRTLR